MTNEPRGCSSLKELLAMAIADLRLQFSANFTHENITTPQIQKSAPTNDHKTKQRKKKTASIPKETTNSRRQAKIETLRHTQHERR